MRTRSNRDELIRVIRSVRRRWRLKVLLRGAAIVLGAGLIVFLVSAYGMDRLRFSPNAVITFRVFAYTALIMLALRFLIMPLVRRVTDERVALYLEEHEPSLGARLLSAVEFVDTGTDESRHFSPVLVERLVENAVSDCAKIDYGRRVEARPLARSSGLLAGTTVAALAVMWLSPNFLRHSTPYLLPFGDARPENPYRIEVSPGNARVARGAELQVDAELFNFDSDQVDIVMQRGVDGEWERFPMGLDEESGTYQFFIFDLEEETEYFVEASGVRSSLFRIDVAELPYVGQLTLEYHFPAYTGLEPRRQEDSGDIAALRGTEVRVFVTPTVPVTAGAVVVEEDTLPLTVGDDGTLTGSLRVTDDALYRIVFESLNGDLVIGSPDYLIDVLSDLSPYISFKRPGRDVNVTNIEEVFVEVEAEDDYGVRAVELVYSVNGEPEQTLELYGGRRKEVTAGHTFYLEELPLVPGDFISYYARASDDNRVSGRQVSTTDIYFMEVRPFDREYRQADQAAAPGGGGAGGFDSSLSQRQRDIIAATFKMVRDRDRYTPDEYGENLATLALAQGRLREQVERLLERLQSRGIVQMDERFEAVAEALPRASVAMREAEGKLGERAPDDALPPEQRALQQLQRAEAAFREVQVGQGGHSAGAGGGGADIDELADLFELELDRQRNQYETVQRDRQQQVDEQIDETLQKLQELARRQQQENEHLRAQANQSRGQSGSGDSQRQLAEEAEELARRLERLAREESQPELNETARALRQAAEEMRRAAANSRNGAVSEGLSALDRLKRARRLLDESRSAGLERRVDDALRRAERLAEEQRDVTRDVERLGSGGAEERERLQRLVERKEEMAAEVEDIEAQLDRLARDSRREQRDAARKLQEAANEIRDTKLEDKIRYSRGVIQQRSSEYARNFEEQIAQDIDEVRRKIEAARDAIGVTKEQRLGRTLDETRDLVRSLESMRERVDQRARSEQERGERRSGEQAEAEQQGERQAQSGASAGGTPRLRSADARQFRREFGERRGEAERLREALEREGIDTRQLDQIIAGLQQLERDRPYGDPRGLEELQAQIIRSLKEFEYLLRREIGAGDARELLLSGSDEVPPGYRELVEEYYKALAERGRN